MVWDRYPAEIIHKSKLECSQEAHGTVVPTLFSAIWLQKKHRAGQSMCVEFLVVSQEWDDSQGIHWCIASWGSWILMTTLSNSSAIQDGNQHTMEKWELLLIRFIVKEFFVINVAELHTWKLTESEAERITLLERNKIFLLYFGFHISAFQGEYEEAACVWNIWYVLVCVSKKMSPLLLNGLTLSMGHEDIFRGRNRYWMM